MRILAILGIVLLTGCPEGDTTPPELGKEFRLGYAQQATIKGENLTLTFTAVTADSRCPSDVQCVWAGQATITVDASKPPEPVSSLTLTIPSPDSASYAGYTITLVDLEPYPTAGNSTHQDDYTALLRVSKP